MFDMIDVKRFIETGGEQVLSVYLKIDPGLPENQPSNPNAAWQIALKNGFSKIGQTIGKQDHSAWKSVHEKAKAQLQHHTPAGKGLIMLVTTDDILFQELPVQPHDNIVKFGKPYILPLMELVSTNKRYFIVLVDKDEARFLSSYMNQVDHIDAMESERFTYDFEQKTMLTKAIGPQTNVGSTSPGGNYRDLYDKKMDTWINRFHSDVADHIRKYLKKHRIHRLIIGGDHKAAHNVEDNLHQSVRKHLVSVEAIPIHLSDHEVLNRLQPSVTKFEQEQDRKLVAELVGQAKAEGGRGTLGQDSVQKALERQQVSELVCAWPPEDEQAVNDLLLDAMLQRVRDVIFVSEQAAEDLRLHGALGARLYYALETVS